MIQRIFDVKSFEIGITKFLDILDEIGTFGTVCSRNAVLLLEPKWNYEVARGRSANTLYLVL